MLKKIIALLLATVSVFSLTACGDVTTQDEPQDITIEYTKKQKPTPPVEEVINYPEYPTEAVSLSELGSYTIVYPAVYTEFRMEDVYFLRDTIKNVLGFELDIKSDAEAVEGNKIILASSVAENGVEGAITLFQSGLDYVVGTLNGNIILGGNNYYADVRGVYDFINNYLGYNDVDDVQGETKSEITGVKLNIYEEPAFSILGSCFACDAYTSPKVIRDMSEANFTKIIFEPTWYTEKTWADMLKWAARFNITVIIRFEVDYLKNFTDCPVIWGFGMDEPSTSRYIPVSEEIDISQEKYGKYGWKQWVNFFGYSEYWPLLDHTDGLYDTVSVTGTDRYFGDHVLDQFGRSDAFQIFEKAGEYARKNGQEYWFYLDSYRISVENQLTQKSFIWTSYIALCFGATGINYFQYGTASDSWSSTSTEFKEGALISPDGSEKYDAWYHAKDANAELLKIGEMYSDYEFLGTYHKNVPIIYDNVVHLESNYESQDDVIEDITGSTPLLIGCFEEKYGYGKAFTMVNLENLTEGEYLADEPTSIKIKINGENVNFYLGGELIEATKDNDGYYTIPMGNGYGYFVTVD